MGFRVSGLYGVHGLGFRGIPGGPTLGVSVLFRGAVGQTEGTAAAHPAHGQAFLNGSVLIWG